MCLVCLPSLGGCRDRGAGVVSDCPTFAVKLGKVGKVGKVGKCAGRSKAGSPILSPASGEGRMSDILCVRETTSTMHHIEREREGGGQGARDQSQSMRESSRGGEGVCE